MKAQHYNSTHKLALAYAASERSDPFTYSRVMSHIANGICDDKYTTRGEPIDCRYSAEEYLETRYLPPSPDHPQGQEYKIPAYKNIRRP